MASRRPLGRNERFHIEPSPTCLNYVGIETRIVLQMLTTVMTNVTGPRLD